MSRRIVHYVDEIDKKKTLFFILTRSTLVCPGRLETRDLRKKGSNSETALPR